MEYDEKTQQALDSFLFTTFNFSEEQLQAIDQQIEMTLEMFVSILERCHELKRYADILSSRIKKEHPNLADKIPELYSPEKR